MSMEGPASTPPPEKIPPQQPEVDKRGEIEARIMAVEGIINRAGSLPEDQVREVRAKAEEKQAALRLELLDLDLKTKETPVVSGQKAAPQAPTSPLEQARESVSGVERTKNTDAALAERQKRERAMEAIEKKEKELAEEMNKILESLEDPKVQAQLRDLVGVSPARKIEELGKLRIVENAVFGNVKTPTAITDRIIKAGSRVGSIVEAYNLISGLSMAGASVFVAFTTAALNPGNNLVVGATLLGAVVAQAVAIYVGSHAPMAGYKARLEEVDRLINKKKDADIDLIGVRNKQQNI